jgi:hypothetical protein
MRKFILITTSDNDNDYQYFIQSSTEPSKDQLMEFLIKHGNNVGDHVVWENIQNLIEVTDDMFIII